MQKESPTALARPHWETASSASSGRSAQTIYGGREHVLRKTLVALRAVAKRNGLRKAQHATRNRLPAVWAYR